MDILDEIGLQPETIVIIVVAAIVMAIFGMFRRKSVRPERNANIDSKSDLRNDSGNRRYSSGMSAFKTLILTLVSLAAGFALASYVIVEFIEPEVGRMDQWDPISIAAYLVAAFIIYRILRLFIRN